MEWSHRSQDQSTGRCSPLNRRALCHLSSWAPTSWGAEPREPECPVGSPSCSPSLGERPGEVPNHQSGGINQPGRPPNHSSLPPEPLIGLGAARSPATASLLCSWLTPVPLLLLPSLFFYLNMLNAHFSLAVPFVLSFPRSLLLCPHHSGLSSGVTFGKALPSLSAQLPCQQPSQYRPAFYFIFSIALAVL